MYTVLHTVLLMKPKAKPYVVLSPCLSIKFTEMSNFIYLQKIKQI